MKNVRKNVRHAEKAYHDTGKSLYRFISNRVESGIEDPITLAVWDPITTVLFRQIYEIFY